jgi:hypothetical protein
MTFRLSQQLNTGIKAGKLGEMPLVENPYPVWSCHLLTAGRTQYIIMSNTASGYRNRGRPWLRQTQRSVQAMGR